MKGAVNTAVVYAKHNSIDATQIAQMGIEIAQAVGVKKEYGLAFAVWIPGDKCEQKTSEVCLQVLPKKAINDMY